MIEKDEVKESEEKYKLIVENAYDLLSIINENQEIEYINEIAHKKLLGYSKEDMVGQKFIQFVHPKDSKYFKHITWQDWVKGKVFPEYRIKKKDGSYIWFHSKVSGFIDTDGKEKLLSISRDIRKEEFAQLELIESEIKYRLVTENANDMIVILNKKFKLEYINEKVTKRILGFNKDDIISKNIINYIHIDDQKKVFCELPQYRKEREGIFEFRGIKRDGTYIWLEAKWIKFMDIDGKEKVLAILRDITDRKITEQELKESEEKYRLITENISDLIVILDKEFKIEYINNVVFKKIFGYSYEEIENETPTEIIHKGNLNQLMKIAKGSLRESIKETVARFKNINGNYIWLEIRGKRFMDKNGETKLFLIVRDISERKLWEERMSRKNALLSAINKIFQETMVYQNEVDVFRTYLNVAKDLTNSRIGFIGEIDKNRNLKIIVASSPNWEKNEYLSLNENKIIDYIKDLKILDIIIQSKTSCIVYEPSTNKYTRDTLKENPKLESFLVFPLKYGNDVNGIICLANKNDGYDVSDKKDLESLSVAFVEALMRVRAEQELKEHKERLEEMIYESITQLKVSSKQAEVKSNEQDLLDQKLKEYELKYKEILDFLPDMIFEIDKNLNITYVNKTVFEIFGYVQEDFIEFNITQIFSSIEINNVKSDFKNILLGAVIKPKYYKLVKKDGSEFWGRIHSTAIYKDEKIVGLRGIIIDVTEQK